jgi:hypothetical protein
MTGGGWSYRLGVPIALVAFAALMFGGVDRQPGSAGALLWSVAVYALTVYLYFGLSALVFAGQWPYVIGGLAIALGLSVGSATDESLWIWTTTWLMMIGATVTTGYLVRTGRPFSTVFAVGALIVIGFSLLQVAPIYPALAESIRGWSDGWLEDVRSQLLASGTTTEMVEEYVNAFRKVLNLLVRLLPCGFVMGAAMQYGLGYAWFSRKVIAPSGQSAVVPAFMTWKAPFVLAIPVLIGSALRLFGGESIELIADNLLAALAIVYAITGMALVEHFLRGVRIGVLGRTLVYVMLFFTQVLGFLIVAMLGFIDSYFDWRGRAQRAIDAGN